MFCPECGVDHHAEERASKPTEAEVRIAKIQADRDIEIARLQAGADVKVTEALVEEDTAHAEGVIEGMETVLEAGAPDPAPVPDPEVMPVVVHETPELEPEIEAPPVSEGSPVPETKKGVGYWDSYR